MITPLWQQELERLSLLNGKNNGHSLTGKPLQIITHQQPPSWQGRILHLREADPYIPLVSPLYANLEGLPPLFLQAGSKEVLLTDATRLAEKAVNANVSVTLDIWANMVHGWQFAASFLPEGRGALEEIGKFIMRYAA